MTEPSVISNEVSGLVPGNVLFGGPAVKGVHVPTCPSAAPVVKAPAAMRANTEKDTFTLPLETMLTPLDVADG
jgi:hypothetical protein